ncbi:MAG TPA: cytochrome c oxidase subunit II [Dongiaceae bacterium]|jgi:cytochrome c oxidase subunit 2
MVRRRGLSRVFAILAALGAFFGVGSAYADEPRPWETGFQAPATPVMERIESFHTELLYIITAISIFVLALLLWVIVRYNERANPKPSRTTHNTIVEVAWTVVPILILVAIVVPSFKLLYFEGDIQKPDMIIKAIGHQWYWSYEYTTDGNFTFDANLVQEKDLKQGQLRLLTTDNPLVVPVDTLIEVQETSTDVIHAWAMPSFGVKTDAVPGKLNDTWFKVTQPGTYYGQCSELCGNGHGYMPIMVQAVSKADYQKWVDEAKKKFAKADGSDAAQIAAVPAN